MSVIRVDDLSAAAEAKATGAELRAGGTDVEERRRLGILADPVVDLASIPGLAGVVATDAGGLRIGAMTRLAELESVDGHPALAAAVRAIVPGLREVGTVGGELLQRTRCWYYRHPAADCFKRGGDGCPAREGDHLYGVVFDTGPCVWPHPSSLATVLVAAGAVAQIYGGPDRLVEEMYGDGSDPRRDHRLAPGEILTALVVPGSGRSVYVRVEGRSVASPLVEVAVVETDGVVRVTAGGIAPAPRRLLSVEEALAAGAEAREAATGAADGATPLPATGYKLELLQAAVEEALTAAGIP